PTRILDVGLSDDLSKNSVKLSELSNVSAQYVCLSHCWGTVRVITTTRQTLAARCQGIPWESLPKTFQDAITYTRRLGLRYLWIDSLCILQDDREDWRRESALMAAIYKNSYITLAATKSPDVQYYVHERIFHFDWRAGFDDAANPLRTRAWAYQGRLLSPRVLHFCAQELAWECQETTQCECLYSERLRATRCTPNLVSLWRYLVEEYSGLRLLEKSDRLPAIAGLAAHIATYKPGKYLAGLWGDSIYEDML
ncbi:HET-domain-containing protein, partial [Mytilinidion resinicola]